jgi:hypothetical protein
MGFRFRRSRTLFPGVRLNLGKKGASVSIGPRGLKHTIGPHGRRTTVGLPGTGMSHTTAHSRKTGHSAAGAVGSIIAMIVFFAALALIFG